MLADPFGKRMIAGPVPEMTVGMTIHGGGGKTIEAGARVEYLVEVGDPSEAAEFGYSINGILVSDFYTPHYFDPVKSAGVRYSFQGAIAEPRQVLKGGYLSWHDVVTDHILQLRYFADDAAPGGEAHRARPLLLDPLRQGPRRPEPPLGHRSGDQAET